MAATVNAIKRVTEIRQKRERAFWKNRMAGNKEKQTTADKAIVKKDLTILPRLRNTSKAKAAILGRPTAEQKEKIKVPLAIKRSKLQSSLAPGEGRSMGMEVDA